MVQWPPSPSVEDEQTSLAKEHPFDTLTLKLKTDNASIPSRGSVDQYPVIVDSDIQNATPVMEATNLPPPPIEASKRTELAHASPLAINRSSLPTPPPSDNESRGRFHPSDTRSVKDEETREPRSKSTNHVDEISQHRSRPSVSRIQTDIAGELHNMKAGTRRAPSPYAYSRGTGTFKVDTSRFTNEHFLSPAHATSSPVSIQASPRENLSSKKDRDSSADSGHRPRKTTRFANTVQGPGSSYGEHRNPIPEPGIPSKFQDIQPQQKFETVQSQPRASRICDRETLSHEGKDVPRGDHRSRSRTLRPASAAQESPHLSSAEDSAKKRHFGDTEKASSEERPVLRRSSHRRERAPLEESLSQIAAHLRPGSPDDDATRHVYHIEEGRSAMTPPTVTMPKHMEDYFSQAFEKNALKGSRYTPRSSFDGLPAFSPPSSPPRTPRTEGPGRGYFQSPSTSPRHASRHSRLPSWDDNQFVGLKAPTSLLSQATAAATIAAKVSPPISRSSSTTIDTNSSGSILSTVSKARSRPQSPVREGSRSSTRADTFPYGEHVVVRPQYTAVPPSNRPSARDGLQRIEVHSANIYQPTRNASWTSYNHQVRPEGNPISSPLYSMATMTTALPSVLHTAPPIYRSQSASTPTEITPKPTQFVLPECSRSQPTKGLRDWTTISGVPSVDICPKCMSFLASTRYHKYFVRSLDKRHDQTTICAMSKPWIRIAFVQSMKQNKSNLTFVKDVQNLPEGVWPCKGTQADIRTWWKLKDPAFDMHIPDFYVCSACVRAVNTVFPELPKQFERADLSQEKSCNLHTGSKHFATLIDELDEVAVKCRAEGKRSARYMQPFVELVRRITRSPKCARDGFLINRPWHHDSDLPEFTICETCYMEVVWPHWDRPVARGISKVTKPVPHSALRSAGIAIVAPTDGTHPISCQLYSDRMRRLFADAITGRISFEAFKTKAKERYAVQWRLTEMNKMYEEDQNMGWDRRAEIEKNRIYWRSME